MPLFKRSKNNESSGSAWPPVTAEMLTQNRALVADELRRLSNGPAPGEVPPYVTTNFIATCPGDPQVVLDRTRETIRVVDEATRERWPTDAEWPSILPAWLLPKFEPEKTIGGNRGWTLPNWIHWFRPDVRMWYYVDGRTDARTRSAVVIVADTDGYIFASENLEWLMRAAGATDVVKDP